MVNDNTAVKSFLADVADERLKNFAAGEYPIVKDNRTWGFRLDHQGVNNDGSGTYRLYIQPVPGRKSKASQLPTDSVVAQIHVTDPGNPQKIREFLFKSFKDGGKLIKLA